MDTHAYKKNISHNKLRWRHWNPWHQSDRNWHIYAWGGMQVLQFINSISGPIRKEVEFFEYFYCWPQLKWMLTMTLHHAQHNLQQFHEILQNNLNKPFNNRRYSWFIILLAIVLLVVAFCYCRTCSCLKLFCSRFKTNSCCGIPNICITNHNKRLELTDEQAIQS